MSQIIEIFLVFLCIHQSRVGHCRKIRNAKGLCSSVRRRLSNLELIDADLIISILENFVFKGQLIARQSNHTASVDLDRDVDGNVLCRRVLNLSNALLISLA